LGGWPRQIIAGAIPVTVTVNKRRRLIEEMLLARPLAFVVEMVPVKQLPSGQHAVSVEWFNVLVPCNCVVERHSVRDPAVNRFTIVVVNPNFPVVDRHWGKTMVCDQFEIVDPGCLLQKYRWRLAVIDELAIEWATQASQFFHPACPFRSASISSYGSVCSISKHDAESMAGGHLSGRARCSIGTAEKAKSSAMLLALNPMQARDQPYQMSRQRNCSGRWRLLQVKLRRLK
jgi:hypothetical protein